MVANITGLCIIQSGVMTNHIVSTKLYTYIFIDIMW